MAIHESSMIQMQKKGKQYDEKNHNDQNIFHSKTKKKIYQLEFLYYIEQFQE